VEVRMGTPLPVVSGRAAAKAFEKLGWILLRQRGSHRVFGKTEVADNLAIPDHRELVPRAKRSQCEQRNRQRDYPPKRRELGNTPGRLRLSRLILNCTFAPYASRWRRSATTKR
jgi:predicted RNA binding protein YcfA (HicA-like mRNA interferase family)